MSLDLLNALMNEDLDAIDELYQVITQAKEDGLAIPQLDDLIVRKMLIKMKYNEKAIEQKKSYRDAIISEWNRQIEKLEIENETMNQTILDYVQTIKKGKPLQLDVANVSIRKTKSNVVVDNKKVFESYLIEHHLTQEFIKTEIDYTKAKNSFLANADKDPESIPPGCIYKPEGFSTTIKFNEK